jgi:homoserine kinase
VPQSLRFDPPGELKLIVAVPQFGLSTKAARQVLPNAVPYADAVFNVSRAALLVGALCRGELDYLRYALEDRLHQPYRAKLIPAWPTSSPRRPERRPRRVHQRCRALPHRLRPPERGRTIGEAMVRAFEHNGVKAAYLDLDVDSDGAKVIEAP